MRNLESKLQLLSLVTLRFFIGWHLLFEGVSKLFTPNWSSLGFLEESKWIMAGFAGWISSSPDVLAAVDFLNIWGLIAIGLSLILGLFSRAGALAGGVMLLLYYLSAPPLTGLHYTVPDEGNNLIINKTLIESIALFVLAAIPTSHQFGLDLLVRKMKNSNYQTKEAVNVR